MRFIEGLMNWESAAEFIGVIAGLGILGYICATWILVFWGMGSYASAVTVALFVLVLAGLALARLAIALIFVFGGAAVSTAAFLSGHIGLLLPKV